MKLKRTLFVLLLTSTTLIQAGPAGLSRDCGDMPRGKRSLSVSYFHGKQQFFTTMFVDVYRDPGNHTLGTYEVYHHSVYCPKDKVPCWQLTTEDIAWLDNPGPDYYAPGVRGLHRLKTANDTILTVRTRASYCSGSIFVEF